MNEGVERKTHPTDEMCEENNPLVGLWSRDDLSLIQESVSDLLGQISGLSERLDILPLDGGGHPLTPSSGSGHLWSAFSDEGKAKSLGA